MGGGKLNTLMHLALVVILIASLFGGFLQVSSSPLEHVTVYVNNNISPGTDMWVHCHSDDRDLGVQKVAFEQNFSWDFWLWIHMERSKRYWCHVWWLDSKGKFIDGTFDMYKGSRDIEGCGKQCSRFARLEGIYIVEGGKLEFAYPWNQK
ncbi:Plant self-incompatibility S1 [Macleaya cordata]|uniref:S-protein homolog n=1 Tax=Macleaya cordata TaxID=56857 RepID=A0A200QS44_MACCD|nr:Plant self-incompatibility S1 [Macleaya cordata]